MKTPMPAGAQHVLCALLNSYVANYLVRLRVGTHVTVSLVSRLPVPLVRPGDLAFAGLAALSRRLIEAARAVEEMTEYAELQALVARLYGLDAEDFAHVLGTFPLVAPKTRQAALAAFNDLQSLHGAHETRRRGGS